jgi:threonine/homoserine/homoserine lactone efflux protein
MRLVVFLSEAVLISLSGVMAPGPITAVAVRKGNSSPHAGALVALGHGIVEFPLMGAILFGFDHLMSQFYARLAIGVLGGLLLLAMGVNMLRTSKQEALPEERDLRSPLVAGILLTIGNPYFLMWWATVGATLISRASHIGLLGFWAFAVVHWLCDFSWLYGLSALSFRGRRLLGPGFQTVISASCGLLLLFFGAKFLFDAAGEFLA